MSDAETAKILARLDALDSMFESDGWQILTNEIREHYEQLGEIDRAATAADFHKAKNQREILNVLLHYPEVIAFQRAQLDEEEPDVAEVV